jgi:predicted nucleic-acid-binding Zn-ribbon protein
METATWQCPKCKNREYETDTMAATGGGWSKIFDVQNKKFTSVTCTNCRYTEFYKTTTSTLGNIFDLFTT